MLGMDKARSSDIGDMLLRFAAAKEATTQEKFQTYLQAESQAGKGRAEKINETDQQQLLQSTTTLQVRDLKKI